MSDEFREAVARATEEANRYQSPRYVVERGRVLVVLKSARGMAVLHTAYPTRPLLAEPEQEKRRGRPRKAVGEAAEHRITARLSGDEYAWLSSHRRCSGMSEALRDLVREAMAREGVEDRRPRGAYRPVVSGN